MIIEFKLSKTCNSVQARTPTEMINREDNPDLNNHLKKLEERKSKNLLNLFGFCFVLNDFFLHSLFCSPPSRWRVFAPCFNPCKTFMFIIRIAAWIGVATFSTGSIFVTEVVIYVRVARTGTNKTFHAAIQRAHVESFSISKNCAFNMQTNLWKTVARLRKVFYF